MLILLRVTSGVPCTVSDTMSDSMSDTDDATQIDDFDDHIYICIKAIN